MLPTGLFNREVAGLIDQRITAYRLYPNNYIAAWTFSRGKRWATSTPDQEQCL